jgi:hypothetical protein
MHQGGAAGNAARPEAEEPVAAAMHHREENCGAEIQRQEGASVTSFLLI